ncbi:MAG: SRPBCC domain-containing protein [Gemmatimonadales bacterium]
MLRFLLLIVAFILVIVGVTFAYGNSLPREHVVTSRIELNQPIDQVWTVVRNPAALRGTWSDLTSAERVTDASGRETWVQVVDGFEMRLQITEAQPPRRMVTTVMADAEAAFGGTWTYVLAATPGGTQVTITEAGYINSPLYRAMGQMFGLHGSIDGYLKALGTHFTEAVRPERL